MGPASGVYYIRNISTKYYLAKAGKSGDVVPVSKTELGVRFLIPNGIYKANLLLYAEIYRYRERRIVQYHPSEWFRLECRTCSTWRRGKNILLISILIILVFRDTGRIVEMATQPVPMEYHPSVSWCLEVCNNFAKNPVTFPLMSARVAFASQLTRCTGSILIPGLLMSVLFHFGWSKS